MAESFKEIKIVDAETLRNRLNTISSLEEFKQYFEPLLLQLAGKELQAPGIIAQYARCMADFNVKMLEVMGEQFKSVIYIYETALLKSFPTYVDALTDDIEVRAKVKTMFEDALNSREK